MRPAWRAGYLAPIAWVVARAFLEKFTGDTIQELRAVYDAFLSAARGLPS